MTAAPSPKQVADYLEKLAAKLRVHGGRGMEMCSLLATRGFPESTNGNGSRSSDQTSSTERAALALAIAADDAPDQWADDKWSDTDQRMRTALRLIWQAGLVFEADLDKALQHGTTNDQLPAGTGYCSCGGDDPSAPTWCGTFCAPRQNGPSDRLKVGLAPNCYKRFDRWRDTHPDGTVVEWKHATRRAREVAEERARQLAAGRAGVRA